MMVSLAALIALHASRMQWRALWSAGTCTCSHVCAWRRCVSLLCFHGYKYVGTLLIGRSGLSGVKRLLALQPQSMYAALANGNMMPHPQHPGVKLLPSLSNKVTHVPAANFRAYCLCLTRSIALPATTPARL